MRIRPVIQATGCVAAAVVLGLFAVQGTYALWNVVVPANAGTVHSAGFTVLLTGPGSTTSYPMTTPDGSPATVSLTGSTSPLDDLYPGDSVYTGLEITNSTNATSDFMIGAAIVGGANVSDSGSNLDSHLIVEAAIPASGSVNDCAAATGYTSLDAVPIVEVANGGAAVMCFRIRLDLEAPAETQNQTASISVQLRVDQLSGQP